MQRPPPRGASIGRYRCRLWTWVSMVCVVVGAGLPASGAEAARGAAPAHGRGAGLPLVMLDPGHGGVQTGARGICGVWEKDVTLQVAHKLGAILTASGLAVVQYTRQDDRHVTLTERSNLANASRARLFISIHANASPSPHAHGIETFFLSLHAASRRIARLALRENEGRKVWRKGPGDPLQRVLAGLGFDANHAESQALAMRLQSGLTTQLAGRGRGVLQAPFQVLTGAQMPAALIEIGFITHAKECARLTDPQGQQWVAQGIAAGILTYLAQAATPPAKR